MITPQDLLAPRRRITGMSAILLPFSPAGDIDWAGLAAHLQRTADAGLVPAVNMDTGYVNLLNEQQKIDVLDLTRQTVGDGNFVAGAFVSDQPGAAFNLDEYRRRMEPICERGGTPVIFQSYGLTGQSDDAIVESYARIGEACDRFIGFELGTMFLPLGAIYSEDVYRQLVLNRKCIGAKHSSLSRDLEWKRLQIRNQLRPDFKVLTGNDLAIDMVMYGSDYLLGLTTFAPDLFARRDQYWLDGDSRFYELNDALQYLGFFAFRHPVPGYKHTAAMFLKLRGWIASNRTHPDSPQRPPSDIEILADIGRLLNLPMHR